MATQRFYLIRVHDAAMLKEVTTLAEGVRQLAEYMLGGSMQASYELRDNEGTVFCTISPGQVDG